VIERDYLWLNLREIPFFRAMVRAEEARYYQGEQLPSPMLDIGCGDGHFAYVAFNRQLEVGIDPWFKPLKEAKLRGNYKLLVQADGGKIPFHDGYFGSAISNSVLEHIPHVDSVLTEVARVLKSGAPFIFCVPNHNFLPTLSIGRTLDSMGLSILGDGYRWFFNRVSRHYHCDPPHVWQMRLERTGFLLERWWNYFSPQALCMMEWGHYFGLPSLISRWLTGKWVLIPTRWNLEVTYRLISQYYEKTPECEQGVYTFFITRRA